MTENLPVGVYIKEVFRNTPTIATVWFDQPFSFIPGQFVMVWVPGVDEIPMALSSPTSITIQAVGEATKALTSLGEGDVIGIRGPFGNGFPQIKGTLAVAGGLGAAPLLPLAEAGMVTTFVLGARTAGELLFRERLEKVCGLEVVTDDGSAGRKGFAVDGLAGIDIDTHSQVCVCGPEKMMVSILDCLKGKNLVHKGQFSLHRYMKCGSGVCGSCCIDPSGARVCREGPVFPGRELDGTEFGQYHRDGSGTRIPF